MKLITIFLPLVLGVVIFSSFDATAETAQERAAAMVQWRESCNDPDPDLRLANIESAITTGDVTIQRICIRCALESDSSDIKNLGLRAAIASKKQITFSAELPKDLENTLQGAKDDKDALNKIYSSNLYRLYNLLQNGISIVVTDAVVTSSTSVWYPLAGLEKQDSNIKGNAIIEGDSIRWAGRISGYNGCSINVKLEPGCKLKGFFKAGDFSLFPISADLL